MPFSSPVVIDALKSTMQRKVADPMMNFDPGLEDTAVESSGLRNDERRYNTYVTREPDNFQKTGI